LKNRETSYDRVFFHQVAKDKDTAKKLSEDMLLKIGGEEPEYVRWDWIYQG